ncbi:MAG: hypothetical protein WC773_02400 [Patescibacteria group bacterium]|jgi:hypothetical protein
MNNKMIFKRYQFIVLGILIILVGVSTYIHYISSDASTVPASPYFHYVTGKVTIVDSTGKVVGPASTQQVIIGSIGASVGTDGSYSLTTEESGCLDVNFLDKTKRTLGKYQLADSFEQQVCYNIDETNPVRDFTVIAVQ